MAVDPEILESFILDKGLSFKKNSVSFVLDCPRCGKDKLYIRRRDGRFICFVCAETENFRGNAEYALSELTNEPLWSVREFLYGESQDIPESSHLELGFDFGARIDDDEDTILESDIPIPTMLWPFDYYPIDDRHSKKGLEYLESRGITLSVAKEYELRYCPQERRVIFPIMSGTKLVGWQKRLVIDNKHWDEDQGKWIETPKILSSMGIPRDRTLMFSHRLLGSPHAVVCEGPVDALKCHEIGGNVATMGKVVSRGQIELILASGVSKVYLALDPDAARETQKLLVTLADLECRLLEPTPGKKDLGEMSPGEVLESFLNAPLLNPGHLFVFFGRR